MAITEWKTISWLPDDDITADKLNQMISNDELMHNNSVFGRYAANNVSLDQNIRIMAGIATMAAQVKGYSSSQSINFSGFFSSGCAPIVTTGVYSTSQRYLMATVQGPGTLAQPNNIGFKITTGVWDSVAKKRNIKGCLVGWTAVGY